MNVARDFHSSCYLKGYLYIFCGSDGIGSCNTVEKLEIAEDPDMQNAKQWTLINLRDSYNLPSLSEHFSVALNNHEILLFGGKNYYKN